MVEEIKSEDNRLATEDAAKSAPKPKSRSRGKDPSLPIKRRCCDGNTPSCAACSSVYGTECVYDPNSDHRRKGVYKKDIDNLKTRNSTLQTLIQAILNYPEEDVPALIREIRNCESLDDVAENIIAKENGTIEEDGEDDPTYAGPEGQSDQRTFESELSGKMGELRLENGCRRFIGGTSNLILLSSEDGDDWFSGVATDQDEQLDTPAAIASWTTVTSDVALIVHLMTMYFTWHYPYFTTLSRNLFHRDFLLGRPPQGIRQKTAYCTPLLVNAMLALGCHFTSHPGARAEPDDLATAGDHFFREAKRLILENDEHEKPRLTTVQALALMSVREAGCGREAKGWVYSGMSFRMACDLGLNIDSGGSTLDEQEVDARRITFWGCFLFDKCWSNYMGRIPQLPNSTVTVPKPVVFPNEDSDIWSPYTDSGVGQANSQPARTRAVSLQISLLCEISSDLIMLFYNPTQMEKSVGKSVELKRLSELHTRLEAWRKNLPKEMGPEPKETPLPPILLMHMFFHLLFIHLYRPFLKYNQTSSPLPSHVSPRKFCTQAASSISKLLRTYKSLYGLRQICNVAVYIVHSACTIHLLNLADKNARRDLIHGLRHLEEIAEGWLCARRTLGILSLLSKRWKIELPEEAESILQLVDERWGPFNPGEIPEMKSEMNSPRSSAASRSPPLTSLPREYRPYSGESPPALNNAGLMNRAVAQESPHSSPVEYGIAPQQRQLTDACAPYPPAPYPLTKEAQLPKSFRDSPRSITGSTHSASPSALLGGVEASNSAQESQDWWLRDPSALALGFDNWGVIEADPSMMGSSNMDGTTYMGNPAARSASNGPSDTWCWKTRREGHVEGTLADLGSIKWSPSLRIRDSTPSPSASQPPRAPRTSPVSTKQRRRPIPTRVRANRTPAEPRRMSSSNEKANLARIRDNQRRSRARRKEYLQSLETRWRDCELQGVQASAEIQAAARRVVDENRKLRSLLRMRGMTEREIDECLREEAGWERQTGASGELEALLGKKRPCSGAKGKADEGDPQWGCAGAVGGCGVNITRHPPSPPPLLYPSAPNTTSCLFGASLITDMGVKATEEDVTAAMGCPPGSEADCEVDNAVLLGVMDRFTGEV